MICDLAPPAAYRPPACRRRPGQIEFAPHPWVVSSEKLKQTTGWSPRHTSRETFEITMRTHGALPPDGATAGNRTTATLAA